jgi:transposase InsO family protein
LEERVPWKVSDPVSERLEFVRRWLDGERVTDLCREYGVSRKTAYKMRARYEELGPRGLFDLPRARKTQTRRTPPEVEKAVLALRAKHPTWGPKKLQAWMLARGPGFKVPSDATIGKILERNNVPRRRCRRRTYTPYRSPLTEALAPNDIWCADFKGQFKLGNGRYCYPLTITDRFSRLIIRCEALENAKCEPAIATFDQAFREYGLPKVIRTDNGVPFAARGLWALSRLSVHWLRLGIWPERIAPAHPEQNGQHERMHLVLKQETTRPPGTNILQQQERFDRFVETYNDERPHEALAQRPPREIYTKSPRAFPRELSAPEYPLHDEACRVHTNGYVWLERGHQFKLGTALAGESVGVREVEGNRYLVTFMQFDLGHYDFNARTFVPNALPNWKETTAHRTRELLHVTSPLREG